MNEIHVSNTLCNMSLFWILKKYVVLKVTHIQLRFQGYPCQNDIIHYEFKLNYDNFDLS